MPHSRQLDAIILGGGQGKRLWPLTQRRAKPAVQIGGKYRLIDVTLSNCIHSNVKNIHILTQFNTASLHRHVFQTYKFDIFSEGNIEILAAQQTLTHTDWFQGTADAVRSYWERFENLPCSHFIILAGDHLYWMDYRKFHRAHMEAKADVTVAVKPVPLERAAQYGVVQTDPADRIVRFVEKPQTAEEAAAVQDPATTGGYVLASMGIYIFRKEILKAALELEGDDFGRDIIPQVIQRFHTTAYRFEGYWEDIGTIGAFFRANLALTQPEPPFSIHDVSYRLFTHPRFLPGSRIRGAVIENSLISEGCLVGRAEIRNSILGIRSVVEDDVVMDRVYQMGADWYALDAGGQSKGRVGVGAGSVLKNVILDKNVRLGRNVRLINREDVREAEGKYYVIRDGIIVVPKDTRIPANTVV
jgi:glucose-1-phosphate adenylyltransferase